MTTKPVTQEGQVSPCKTRHVDEVFGCLAKPGQPVLTPEQMQAAIRKRFAGGVSP